MTGKQAVAILRRAKRVLLLDRRRAAVRLAVDESTISRWRLCPERRVRTWVARELEEIRKDCRLAEKVSRAEKTLEEVRRGR